MKRKSLLITIVNIALLTASVGLYVSADGSNAYKSQGNILFTNDTADASDDVVFDASDFDTIDTIITDGKSQLATSLNAYPNTNVASLDTFVNLSSAIDTITEVPGVYYYDKTTEGEGCERYVLEDGSYYPCDMYGVKTSDTALSDTVVVVDKSDTSSPAAGEKHLVQYVGIEGSSVSAGYAGYADKTFVLGSGADNVIYKNDGYNAAAEKINKNVKLVAKTFNSWNSTSGTSIGVPAGHYFIVNTSSLVASSGRVEESHSHSNGVIYKATSYTTVSWTQTTDSANYYNCLQVVYWPIN